MPAQTTGGLARALRLRQPGTATNAAAIPFITTLILSGVDGMLLVGLGSAIETSLNQLLVPTVWYFIART
jgi:hypothetical protein